MSYWIIAGPLVALLATIVPLVFFQKKTPRSEKRIMGLLAIVAFLITLFTVHFEIQSAKAEEYKRLAKEDADKKHQAELSRKADKGLSYLGDQQASQSYVSKLESMAQVAAKAHNGDFMQELNRETELKVPLKRGAEEANKQAEAIYTTDANPAMISILAAYNDIVAQLVKGNSAKIDRPLHRVRLAIWRGENNDFSVSPICRVTAVRSGDLTLYVRPGRITGGTLTQGAEVSIGSQYPPLFRIEKSGQIMVLGDDTIRARLKPNVEVWLCASEDMETISKVVRTRISDIISEARANAALRGKTVPPIDQPNRPAQPPSTGP